MPETSQVVKLEKGRTVAPPAWAGGKLASTHLSWPVLLLGAVFLLQWLALFRIASPVWDEAFYYAYAHSVAFDGDLRLENDLLRSYAFTPPFFVEKAFHAVKTSTGRVDSPFAVGTAILWAPLLALVRLAAIMAGGSAAEVTGYEWYFVGITASFSALTALLAFVVAYRLSRAVSDRPAALASVLTLMFATPLLHYQFRAPLMSHTTAALATGLVLAAWWWGRARNFSPYGALALGAALGFAALVRWQHVIYLALPATSVALHWLSMAPQERGRWWRVGVRYLMLVGAAALLLFSVQFAVWRVFYGSWVTVPQGDAFMNWRASFLEPTLFSTYRGLLAWMPVVVPAALGLLLLLRRRLQVGLPLLLVLLLSLYVNSSTPDWFAGGGFGPRRFASELALFAVGYAALLQRLPRRVEIAFATVAGVVLGIHQWILLRFGVPEKLGGEHITWIPTFRWVDDGWPRFLQRLAAHVPDLAGRPRQVFLLPESPLAQWTAGNGVPLQSLLALLGATLFLASLLLLARFWWQRLQQRQVRAWVVAAVLFIALVDFWVLLLA